MGINRGRTVWEVNMSSDYCIKPDMFWLKITVIHSNYNFVMQINISHPLYCTHFKNIIIGSEKYHHFPSTQTWIE